MDAFANLSTPAKITVAGVPVSVAAADGIFIAQGADWKIVLLFSLLGLLVAGVIVWLVYRFIRKRRGKAFGDDIDAATRRSSGAGRPDERAAMEDLRRRFLEGFNEYKREGFNAYEVPWYLVMGEPGSGKTFAVKHSGIGFLPGMQDERQGTGGTKTMDWWFTKSGVLLDTAGRWSTGSAGGQTLASQELAQFLRLLRKHRNHCPINGLILVLDGQRMQRETEAETREKAKQLTEALFQVKRELDVRFPVIVWISKCDTIPGFRSYFQSFSDVKQQQQMLGWSNPAENIDEPFHAEQVEEYLAGVTRDLRQRRWQQMYDVSPPGDSRRTDAVDSLFVFPAHLEKLTPAIRLYLEIIFGDMRRAPFLRGIYFNSAITEGAEADSKIAEAMGLSPEEYTDKFRGSSSFRQDRSYFIRDTLAEKLFKEKNLVTRATNAVAALRRTQIIFVIVLALCLLGMAGVAWKSSQKLGREIGDFSSAWQDAASTKYGVNSLFTNSIYVGNNTDAFKMLNDTLANCATNARIPPPFGWFLPKNAGISQEDRRKAWEKIYRNYYLGPLVTFLESSTAAESTNLQQRVVALVQFDNAFSKGPNVALPSSGGAFPQSLFDAFFDPANARYASNNARLMVEAATAKLISTNWYAPVGPRVQAEAKNLFARLRKANEGQLAGIDKLVEQAKRQINAEVEFVDREEDFWDAVKATAAQKPTTEQGLAAIAKGFENWRKSKPINRELDLSQVGGDVTQRLEKNFKAEFGQLESSLKAETSSDLAGGFVLELEGLGRTNVTLIERQWKAVTNRLDLDKTKQDSGDSEALLSVVAHALTLFGKDFGPQANQPLAGWIRFREKTNALSHDFGVDWRELNLHALVPMAADIQRGRAFHASTEMIQAHLVQLRKWPLVGSESEGVIAPNDLEQILQIVNAGLSNTNVLGGDVLNGIPELKTLKDLYERGMRLSTNVELVIEMRALPSDNNKDLRGFRVLENPTFPQGFTNIGIASPIGGQVGRGPFKYEVRYSYDVPVNPVNPVKAVSATATGEISGPWGLLPKMWDAKKQMFKTNEFELPLNDGKAIKVVINGRWAQ